MTGLAQDPAGRSPGACPGNGRAGRTHGLDADGLDAHGRAMMLAGACS
jgi:hypothetical protein